MIFRTLKANEIDVRVGQVFSTGYTLLLYKDARCDMNILDSFVIWQRDHKEIKGNLYCGVGIYFESLNQFVWKWDCGTESNTEKEKGEASDSFKRACVNWGIGRELYTAPFIFVQGGVEKDGNKYVLTKEEKKRKFSVIEITYNNNNEIETLVIIDTKRNVVFSNKKQNFNNGIAGDFIMPHGKHTGKALSEISPDYLDWYLAKGTSENVKENIKLMRNGLKEVNL